MTLGSIDILTVWIFLNSWSWDIFEFVFNFFKQCFYSFHCTNLPWLISKYFILFDDISSGIVFYSHCSLIAYRTVADFLCVDFLSYNLADLFIGSNRFVGVCVSVCLSVLGAVWVGQPRHTTEHLGCQVEEGDSSSGGDKKGGELFLQRLQAWLLNLSIHNGSCQPWRDWWLNWCPGPVYVPQEGVHCQRNVPHRVYA